ncbi:hypothetical protein JW365_11215, partial [Gordonia sp. BP-94]|nr:hypothetical protein [Gordonia sp. BP-94]
MPTSKGTAHQWIHHPTARVGARSRAVRHGRVPTGVSRCPAIGAPRSPVRAGARPGPRTTVDQMDANPRGARHRSPVNRAIPHPERDAS